MKRTRIIACGGIFIAINILLTRFLSIQTNTIRIGFGFISIVICAIMFGPVMAAIVAAIGDILGMIIAPRGLYFPGFTLSAFISGYIYGIAFFKKTVSLSRIILCVMVITIFVNVLCNTLWVSMIGHVSFKAIVYPRLIKDIIIAPIHVIIIYQICKNLKNI